MTAPCAPPLPPSIPPLSILLELCDPQLLGCSQGCVNSSALQCTCNPGYHNLANGACVGMCMYKACRYVWTPDISPSTAININSHVVTPVSPSLSPRHQ